MSVQHTTRNPLNTLKCLPLYKVPQGIPGALLTMSIYDTLGIPCGTLYRHGRVL
jgi:hypothetical protein